MKRLFLLLATMWAAAGLVRAGEKPEADRRIDTQTPWLCYYGEDRKVLSLPGYKLLILEPDSIGALKAADKGGRLCVGYMSIGEVEEGRWFWPLAKGQPWVLEPNPDWPDSRRVDPRSPEWRRLLVDRVAARIVELGYDGFFLDNVDTGELLVESDAKRFREADKATVELVRALRARYPNAVIVANNGLGVVPCMADRIDAMMYEGTVSTWFERDDGTYGYAEISAEDKEWLAPRLARIRRTGLPILALEYVDPADKAQSQKVWDAVVGAGDSPYLSVRDLDVYPGSGLPTAPARAGSGQ